MTGRKTHSSISNLERNLERKPGCVECIVVRLFERANGISNGQKMRSGSLESGVYPGSRLNRRFFQGHRRRLTVTQNTPQ
ncbi:hypothetical protein A2778_05155 [Candidatus Daviesbacteria bacterium RIFCSPHIGHO2_01_FULL_40_24]|nr:MAG: hypothetical protein A2778_05155 [Candidatus Daviesbacteria bacterium RIFCSPHIGHO2_01_FULL_40_24]OGE29040.1 MAG: hypothetical protein A3C29_06680 [Candidatus Daviesbacteria bacterium RIFCSPHIGHO2_02_FULL_40_16]OGE43622.1 MAG: hypothetical protein A3A53_03260 [Candidatus Daviesbacteria bacterium RIFCSPLOWO2_01_FULL_39_23]OGE67894.1 MAG: hypothetical protein A3J16_03150 [Candidatus Daviesbacteria bacterium RIFCSPLOWO2_02_FULL_39_13]HCE31045.1 hypothetical protein [Candidatus Daviesbacteri